MKQGIHIIERRRLAALAREGVDVPRPWLGILDALRMVQGHLPEPLETSPLGLTGLDGLLAAANEDPTNLLRAIRGGLVAARRYFAWKNIPLVLLLEGDVDDPRDDSGLHLEYVGQRWALAALLGTHLEPAKPGVEGWWWAPQIG
ncbi:hypothetical protein DB30_05995 [Enhygromyxa salina]|uniref:Uncharacterized protein n=1 Tax=Enhygromyxa salina TaxID=215803 RepID=A0A0C2D7F3_9BACT|nr:hypothetical protein [Enhygromyxa salina]KIG19091.1 hypothetical protein DB30_05995 [Enhygromyxa salina]